MDNSQKFLSFMNALDALCVEHKVVIYPENNDGLLICDAVEGEYFPDFWSSHIRFYEVQDGTKSK